MAMSVNLIYQKKFLSKKPLQHCAEGFYFAKRLCFSFIVIMYIVFKVCSLEVGRTA